MRVKKGGVVLQVVPQGRPVAHLYCECAALYDIAVQNVGQGMLLPIEKYSLYIDILLAVV